MKKLILSLLAALTPFAGAQTVTGSAATSTQLTTETAARIAGDTTNANSISAHTADTANPHAVTKAQVGLGNVDNTSDADKPVSTAQAAAIAAGDAGIFVSTTEFVMEGDSLTSGVPATYPANFSSRVAPVTQTNVAWGGETLANMASQYSTQVYPRRPAATGKTRTYLLFWVGANDMNDTTTYPTPSDWLAAYNSYVAQAKADGFTVVGFTILHRSAAGSWPASRRVELNAGIRRNPNVDILIDAERILPDSTDTNFFADGTHYNAAGGRRIAAYIEAALASADSKLRGTTEWDLTNYYPPTDYVLAPRNGGTISLSSTKSSGVAQSLTTTNGSATSTYEQRRDTAPFHRWNWSSSSVANDQSAIDGTLAGSSGVQTALAIRPTVNQSGTAGYYGLQVVATHTATGSGTKRLVELVSAGTTRFYVEGDTGNGYFNNYLTVAGGFQSNANANFNGVLSANSTSSFTGTATFNGNVAFDKTITAAGTTGAQTINKNLGSVNFAAGATSLVVTDSRVTANSCVFPVVSTNDATMKTAVAVPAAGSFTIYPDAAPTNETRVSFIIFN
jgi:hypothetical protein